MRASNKRSGKEILDSAFELRKNGLPDNLIELPERAVFPHLIPVQPSTARKSRITGTLQGREAPRFIKRGRSVYYRLSDCLAWLEEGAES